MLLWSLIALSCLARAAEEEKKSEDPQKEKPKTDEVKTEELQVNQTQKNETEPEKATRFKVLVLYEDYGLKYTHSVWLANVKRVGDITYKSAADPELKLSKYNLNLYHTIILMAPSVEHFGGNVTEETFVEFVDRGGNLFMAADPTIGAAISNLGSLFGVEFAEPGQRVVSHTQVDQTVDDGTHTSFVIKTHFAFTGALLPVYGDNAYYSMPWSNAVGMTIPPESEALPLVKCHEDCYTANTDEWPSMYPGKNTDPIKGYDLSLMALVQRRGRVLIAGSMDVFSDKTIWREKIRYVRTVDNEENASYQIASYNSTPKLIMHSLGWVAGQKLLYRVRSFRNFLVDDIATTSVKDAKFYVNDTVRFEFNIQQQIDDQWLPGVDSGHIFQLELNRAASETFVRTNLTEQNGGVFYADIRLPDVVGVFHAQVAIAKPGYNVINIRQKIVVNPIPYHHYPRFLECAYPYYLSAFSMMLGAFSLSYPVLYHQDKLSVKKKQ